MSHHPIATVAAVTGSAFARNENGELRVLKAGDTLLEGEVVLASADGHVELSFVDNSTMEVVEDQSVTLTSDLLESGPFDATDSALADDTAERILQLLAEDKEIDEAIEAPAAGLAGGEGGGGNNFVRLLRIAEGVDPLHYEFSGTSGTEAATFENPLEVDDDGGIGGATITVDTITADDIINSVEDDAPITVNGTVAGDAAAGDTVSFTVNGTEYTTTVNPDGTTWSVAVSGSDLAADAEFEATVTGTDVNGNPFTGSTTSTHEVAPMFNIPEARQDRDRGRDRGLAREGAGRHLRALRRHTRNSRRSWNCFRWWPIWYFRPRWRLSNHYLEWS